MSTMKICASKLIIISINLICIAILFVVCISYLHQPPALHNENFSKYVRSSLCNCRPNETENGEREAPTKRLAEKKMIPSFFCNFPGHARIALANMAESEAIDNGLTEETMKIQFDRVQPSLNWSNLFSLDEENNSSSCPEIPMPDFSLYNETDAVVAGLPCRWPESGWTRDAFRLQVHLVVANLVVRRGAKDQRGKVKVVLKSKCQPMMEIFRCDDLVRREGEWWLYEVEVERLAEVVALPVGPCNLALDLASEGSNMLHQSSKLSTPDYRREAYATILHSSDRYVCGAIVLAHSILKTGSTRDLILLHDASIPKPELQALSAAGWQLRQITRIRNPKAKRGSYNEYNYSKLRLWQLTDYYKILFVDSDLLIIHNIDFLFRLPEISAASNHDEIFNSGVMVIEPSNCTFKELMRRRSNVISYNGGDQGFLNEVFVWWHRMPKEVNYLTFASSNLTADLVKKNYYFGSDPVKAYGIHYLGQKPWTCYRDYDCNWNRLESRVFANDVAHWRWWTVYDGMDDKLKQFCGLSEMRRESLDKDRKMAEKLRFEDEHWKLKITDPRKNE